MIFIPFLSHYPNMLGYTPNSAIPVHDVLYKAAIAAIRQTEGVYSMIE